jgi:hypothetical protein
MINGRNTVFKFKGKSKASTVASMSESKSKAFIITEHPGPSVV